MEKTPTTQRVTTKPPTTLNKNITIIISATVLSLISCQKQISQKEPISTSYLEPKILSPCFTKEHYTRYPLTPETTTIPLRINIVQNNHGDSIDQHHVQKAIEQTKEIYQSVITFQVSISNIHAPQALTALKTHNLDLPPPPAVKKMFDVFNDPTAINAYYIPTGRNDILGEILYLKTNVHNWESNSEIPVVMIYNDFKTTTLPHEIGHVFGLQHDHVSNVLSPGLLSRCGNWNNVKEAVREGICYQGCIFEPELPQTNTMGYNYCTGGLTTLREDQLRVINCRIKTDKTF